MTKKSNSSSNSSCSSSSSEENTSISQAQAAENIAKAKENLMTVDIEGNSVKVGESKKIKKDKKTKKDKKDKKDKNDKKEKKHYKDKQVQVEDKVPLAQVVVDKLAKKPKLQWDAKQFSILKIEPPCKLDNPAIRKRFSIRFSFKDMVSKKIFTKTVRFGDKNVKEFIDDHDTVKKYSFLNRVRHCDNILHKNFWTLNLLNSHNTVLESYTKLLGQMDLI